MKKVSNNLQKLKYIIIGILVIAIIGIVIALNNSGVITKLGNAIRRNIFALDEENIETTSYYTIGAINGDYLTCQIAFENALGIEKITANEVEIDGKGKTKVGVDRILQEGEELQFNVKIVGKEQEEIHKLIASTKPKIVVTNIDTLGDETTKTVEIEYPNSEDLINYYSLDDGETWQEYTGTLNILNAENKTIIGKSLYNKDKTIECINEKDSLIVSDSLLSATEKSVMHNDRHYRISVKDEEYTVHTYVEDESLTLSSNTTYGDSEYAKNMVIVKINGDLTINSGVTLTAYGQPKGMLVYASGTVTNNGTINMTEKGSKAEGQNVYLWKNQDISNAEYEYVPAIGASGGEGYPGNGKKGENGVNRQTGGGGSGAGHPAYASPKQPMECAENGGTGTSYSGGKGTNSKPENAGGAVTSGGLLIIYGNSVINNASITANGTNGTRASGTYVSRRRRLWRRFNKYIL